MCNGVKGVGIDLCAVARMEAAIQKPRFMERVFTPQERGYIAARGACAGESAAAMFAAKEAVAKALGTGFSSGVMPAQIEVTHAQNGAPGVVLCGRARERLRELGGKTALISLTHEGETAMAMAMIVGG